MIEKSGRRVFDIAVASAFLIASLPLAILIAMAIVLESGRPIFFVHRRIGQHGQPFSMIKFRKFMPDCSAHGLQLTLSDDDRFTRVGRILASTKLDELPQFWNVLVGDMSIIGPRPESLQFADCFKDGFERVLDYRPGIFGPTQAQFRNEAALFPEVGDLNKFYRTSLFPAKAKIDLQYYPNRTLASDVAWLYRGMIATLGLR